MDLVFIQQYSCYFAKSLIVDFSGFLPTLPIIFVSACLAWV